MLLYAMMANVSKIDELSLKPGWKRIINAWTGSTNGAPNIASPKPVMSVRPTRQMNLGTSFDLRDLYFLYLVGSSRRAG